MSSSKILLLFLIFALGFIVLLLLGVGFLTLYERHLLGVVANRVGPNKSSGIMPILDGVKLLSKGKEELVLSEYFLYVSIPILGFSLMLLEYLLLPTIPLSLKMGFLLFSFLVGSFVYVVMLVGVFSSSKYSLLGSIRSSASVISYEVCFLVFLFSILTLEKSMVMEGSWSILKSFVMGVWMVGVLSETNRTPYDFSEGESELVSGFNTEYSSVSFTLLFLSEYGSILFFSYLTSYLFFNSGIGFLPILFFLIGIRSVLPRFRYDKLMALFWLSFLPISLFYLSLLILF